MSHYVVVIDIVVRPGADAELARVFSGPFKAAILAQDGFRSVQLLRPLEGNAYILIISFADRALQQKWVATDLHAEVWSAMEVSFSSYSLRTFHDL